MYVWLDRVVIGALFLFILIFTIVDVFAISKNSYNLVSAAGMLVFLAFMFLFSHNPAKVSDILFHQLVYHPASYHTL